MAREMRFARLKLDIIFKKMFGEEKNVDVLISFLSAMLSIPRESISNITFKNNEVLPTSFGKKFSILDILMEVDGKVVNIEMQLSDAGNYEKRSLYYCSKLYSGSLDSGEDYEQIPRVICINILNFSLFDKKEFSSHYEVADIDTHRRLEGSFDIYYFELTKIGKHPNKDNIAELWLQLINAETEEELAMLENTNVQEIKHAVTVLREMSADEKIQEEIYYREKQLHDEANALNTAAKKAKEEGRAEGINDFANEMRKMGYPEEKIQTMLKNLMQ